MKVRIEATQEEFDTKREELSRILMKSFKEKTSTPALKPRRAVIRAQNEIFDYWSKKFDDMIRSLKSEIEDILESKVEE